MKKSRAEKLAEIMKMINFTRKSEIKITGRSRVDSVQHYYDSLRNLATDYFFRGINISAIESEIGDDLKRFVKAIRLAYETLKM